MLVPAAQLNMSNLRTSSLLLAAPGGNEAAWSMSVRPGAVRECGMLLLAQWAPCGGPPAEALAEVFLQLPEPKAVRVSGAHVSGTAAQQAWAGTTGVTLAPQGDLATPSGIDVPSSATFSVEVDFVDPVSGAESTRKHSCLQHGHPDLVQLEQPRMRHVRRPQINGKRWLRRRGVVRDGVGGLWWRVWHAF